MKCPLDQVDLVMSDRQGIEIDYCPQCRGVWLDRGELDKIIERTEGTPAAAPIRQESHPPHYQESHHQESRSYEHPSRHEYSDDYNHGHKKHKKEGFLGDLFDF